MTEQHRPDHHPSEPHQAEQRAEQRPPVGHLSYEQARDELVDIVARLESGQVGLEESMRLWERGEELATHCATWLDAAQARIARTETATGAETAPEGQDAAPQTPQGRLPDAPTDPR